MQSNNFSSTNELNSQKLTIGIPLFVTVLSVVAILTVVLNSIILIAILKKRLQNTPSNFLLTVLCCNDLLTGLIALPLYAIGVSQRRTWLIFEGYILVWGSVFNYIFQGLSFQLLALVSLDRYFSICQPVKYINHATSKLYTRILACTVSIYLMITVVARLIIRGDTSLFRYIYTNIYTVIVSTIIFVCSWKICKVIQRKVAGTTGEPRQELDNVRRTQREGKRAYVIFLLISVHYLCYLPFYICTNLIQINPSIFSTLVHLTFVKRWCFFPLFLNGVFNPVIYYLRMPSHRSAVKELLGCS